MSTEPSTSPTLMSELDLEVEPADAHRVFSVRGPYEALGLARRYVEHLATTGVDHGLIGPREVPRLWSRHVINCAVVADLVPQDAHVIDVGSGAGLPGLPLAITRPDLRVTLLEPLERRCRWLSNVVEDLALTQRVTIVRGRAEDVRGTLFGDVVTSRAVASLPKLLSWSLPLTRPGGLVLAMKGERAPEELAAVRDGLGVLGIVSFGIEMCGVDSSEGPVRVVRVEAPQTFDVKRVSRAFAGGDARPPGRSAARKKRAGGRRPARTQKEE